VIIIKNNTLLNKCNDSTKFWIFNIPSDYLSRVLSNDKLATVKKKSININKINANDMVIIASKINNSYSIIALTIFNSLYEDDEKLFGYYESTRKIKLKSFKYFKNLLLFNDLKNQLSLNTLSKKEIVEITKNDFEVIINSTQISNEKPLYLSDITINYENFLINYIETTYNLLKMNKQLKQMEIKEFIKLIENNIKLFNLKISKTDIEKFYSRNIWKLNYKHVPSRDSKENILLYDATGKSKNYRYIIFNY